MYLHFVHGLISGEVYTKKIGAEVFEELRNVVQEENGEDKMAIEITNGVHKRIGEKRTLLNNILCRKGNLNGHILRRCLFHDAVEEQMTEVKEVERRRTQLLDDLRHNKILRAKGGS